MIEPRQTIVGAVGIEEAQGHMRNVVFWLGERPVRRGTAR